MGYYTTFELNIEKNPDNIEMKDVIEKINEIAGWKMFEDLDNEYCHAKWYDFETEMAEVSKLFPNTVFSLSGEGEDSDDLWRAYFKNGVVKIYQARILYDDENWENELNK